MITPTIPIRVVWSGQELPRVVENDLAEVEDQRYMYTCDVCGNNTMADGHVYRQEDKEHREYNVCLGCEITNELI